MKKKILAIITLSIILLPTITSASSVSKTDILKLLNWENAEMSFTSDLITKTITAQKTIKRDSKIYKRGSSLLRIDTEPAMLKAYGQANQQAGNFYMIKNTETKTAYMVFPKKKAYIEANTDEIKKIIGELGKQLEDKKNNKHKIKSFEKLGKKTIGGIECEKVHTLTQDQKGISYDITAWLAHKFNNFPVKTLIITTMPGGQQITNSTYFQNIKKKAPEKNLYKVPSEYKKYSNLVQLHTDGKAGAGIEVLKNRLRNRKR